MTTFWPNEILAFTFYVKLSNSIRNWTNFVKEVFWFNALFYEITAFWPNGTLTFTFNALDKEGKLRTCSCWRSNQNSNGSVPFWRSSKMERPGTGRLLRCLYTMVKMLRSVHCGDDAVLHYVCLYNLVMVLHCMFQLTDTSVKGSEWDTTLWFVYLSIDLSSDIPFNKCPAKSTTNLSLG